jgi:hypothetical protein
MRPHYQALIFCLLLLPSGLRAQSPASAANFLQPAFPAGLYGEGPALPPPSLPRMAPELAMQAFQQRSARQNTELAGYSATTLIRAELPQTSQHGEYELRRRYSAPRSLQFKAVRFVGDNFVKSNIITRLLQSEVDHVEKDDSASTALSPLNYKFSYKGTNSLEGRVAHVYQVKPRKKRSGLFKGRIYLDVHTGSLLRAEGSLVKSPSFFVKKIEFVQDYVDIGQFTFPVHIHSEAKARLVGRAVVDIYHRDYEPVANPVRTARSVTFEPLTITTE